MPPPVSVKFPEVVAAVRAAEECPWKIGDALIKECGRPGDHGVNTGAFDKLEQCARELRRLRLETYSLDHFRDMRRTAANFSDGDRSPSASWTVHSEAGDPATLKAAMEAATREGVKCTVDYVKDFKKRQRQGEERAQDPQSTKTLAMLELETALANVIDLGVPTTEVIDLIQSTYAQRWPDFVTAFEEYCLREAT